MTDYLLQENGSYLLQENNDKIILVDGTPSPTTTTTTRRRGGSWFGDPVMRARVLEQPKEKIYIKELIQDMRTW